METDEIAICVYCETELIVAPQVAGGYLVTHQADECVGITVEGREN